MFTSRRTTASAPLALPVTRWEPADPADPARTACPPPPVTGPHAGTWPDAWLHSRRRARMARALTLTRHAACLPHRAACRRYADRMTLTTRGRAVLAALAIAAVLLAAHITGGIRPDPAGPDITRHATALPLDQTALPR